MFKRISLIAAALVIVAAGIKVPDGKAWVRFTDGSGAEPAMACYADMSTMMTINGARSFSTRSWQETGFYASTTGIFVSMRAYDRYLGYWTPYTSWAPLNKGYGNTALSFPRLLQGTYTYEVTFAKQIAGAWQYRTQLVKVLQVDYSGTAVDMVALLNYTGAMSTICRQ